MITAYPSTCYLFYVYSFLSAYFLSVHVWSVYDLVPLDAWVQDFFPSSWSSVLDSTGLNREKHNVKMIIMVNYCCMQHRVATVKPRQDDHHRIS
jgi:hypothetical protein